MIVWFTPSMIEGFANGICTCRNVCREVAPNDVETSMDVSDTPRTPNAVNRIAGGNAKTKVAISAGGSPTPNNRTNGRRYEYAGIVCMASRIGRNARSTRGRRPAHRPTGTPIAIARLTDTSINARVSIAASQTPSSPKQRNPAAARTPIRHPATTPAIIAALTVRPNQVIRLSTVTVASNSEPNPSEMGFNT